MNKNVYVYAEQREGVIQPVAFELLGKARDLADVLGEKVVAILAGHNISASANELIAYGADDVVVDNVQDFIRDIEPTGEDADGTEKDVCENDNRQ
jgi:electron transfer flavoprotein alpha subunit